MGDFLVKVVKTALRGVSPEIRQAFEGLYQSLKSKAAETENLWDDLFVEVVGVILGFED